MPKQDMRPRLAHPPSPIGTRESRLLRPWRRSIGLALTIASPLVASRETTAQDSTRSNADSAAAPYFYRGLPYGSDAYMNPLAVFVNKGYAVSVFESSNRKVLGAYGWNSVGDALAHPFAAIERGGGWGTFLRQEMLPLTFTKSDAKWVTNYLGHVFEGGIYYRRLTEWYQAKGLPVPALLAGATAFSAALWNELYETRGSEVGGSGTVADLYVFDLAGIALFSFDAVPRFFARTLHANVWVGQASLVLPSGEIANNTNLMYWKVPWKVVPSSSVFLWAGIGSMAASPFTAPTGWT